MRRLTVGSVLILLAGCAHHPLDCAAGYAHEDCLPGTAGYNNFQHGYYPSQIVVNPHPQYQASPQPQQYNTNCYSYGAGNTVNTNCHTVPQLTVPQAYVYDPLSLIQQNNATEVQAAQIRALNRQSGEVAQPSTGQPFPPE